MCGVGHTLYPIDPDLEIKLVPDEDNEVKSQYTCEQDKIQQESKSKNYKVYSISVTSDIVKEIFACARYSANYSFFFTCYVWTN